jgi:CHAD domain-containing protein
MAYSLAPDESTPAGVKRVIRTELDSAAAQLRLKRQSGRGESIHEARKSVKKTRAALRLVKDELAGVFGRANHALRNASHELARFRDAVVAIDTFEAVLKEGKLKDTAFSSIRQDLEHYKARAEKARSLRGTMAELAAAFTALAVEVETWPLASEGFAGIEEGLKRSYRKGIDAMVLAEHEPSPENYHNWRKRVKDHWYHVTLLQGLWNKRMKKDEKLLKKLETSLGNDHDLVLLIERVRAKQATYDKADSDAFFALAEIRQGKLRKRSLRLGGKIYGDKPRRFTKRIKKRWNGWHQKSSA